MRCEYSPVLSVPLRPLRLNRFPLRDLRVRYGLMLAHDVNGFYSPQRSQWFAEGIGLELLCREAHLDGNITLLGEANEFFVSYGPDFRRFSRPLGKQKEVFKLH